MKDALITFSAEWATPANTALLIVLAAVQYRQNGKVKQAKDDVTEAQRYAVDAKRAVGAIRRNEAHPDTGERRRWSDRTGE
jgi:hypothetical protein